MTNTTTEPVASARIIPNEYYALEGQTVCVMRMFAVALALSLKNRVLYITDDEEQYNRFKKLIVNNKEFGNDDNALLVKNGNKNYLNQKLYDNMDKFLNMNEKKKFDCIIMNPPYDKNLHLKILEKVIPVADKVVNVSPIRWLQDPLAKYKRNSDYKRYEDTISKMIESLEVVEREKAAEIFNIRQESDLGILMIGRGGFDYVAFSSNPIIEKMLSKSDCFLSNVMESNNSEGWRVKLVDLKPLNAGSNGKKGTAGWYNRYILLHQNKSWVYKDGYQAGKHWSAYNGTSGCKVFTEDDKMPASIKFDTKVEAENFENSTKTMFYKYLVFSMKMNSHTPFTGLPFMKGYTQPWTDKRFCEYFGITGYIDDEHAEPDSEWETILNTMKELLFDKIVIL